MKIISIEEINQRLQTRFPNESYTILEYTRVSKPFIIQCNDCGNIIKSSNFRNFMMESRKTICYCHNVNNHKFQHERNKKHILNYFLNNDSYNFLNFSYNDKLKKHMVNYICKKCSQIVKKDWESFLQGNTKCPYCESKHNLSTIGYSLNLPQEYTLISEYLGNEKHVLIKHQCGFIWKIKPHYLQQRIHTGLLGCPHCNHKMSRGEKAIQSWLINRKIAHEKEKKFSWSSNSKFRYDFYIPDYNLIIEYMGEQHYKEVDFFHDTLAERQEHDQIKEKEARDQGLNYLIISYKNFKNIDIILEKWFNDYPSRSTS